MKNKNNIICPNCNGNGWTEHSPGHTKVCKLCDGKKYIENRLNNKKQIK